MWYDGLEDAPDATVYNRVYRGEHILKRAWWWLFGIPPAEDLREEYGTRPFTAKEERRIREIVREDGSSQR